MLIPRNSFAVLILLLAVVLTSCGGISSNLPVFYTPAATSNHMSYLPKPMISDSVKARNYVSASFADNTLPYETGSMSMGFVNYNRSNVIGNFNFSYGGFGYFGGTSEGYENTRRKISDDFYQKGVVGFGLRTSAGVAQVSGNTEFRILNWETALVYEGGSYASFRKDLRAKSDSLSIASNKTTLFTTGGSTELIWHGRKNPDRQYGFRLFLGSTIGLKRNINYSTEKISGLAADFSFFIKIKNAYGIVGTGSNLMNNSGKITIGYAF
ncbi:hypothetical protein [Pedobacter endophyticus]|uniref:Outer membrane protein beta-barrel domain-containing protein n=1 Tax=Pedobacter endophyticus TaxID=2789740 RepID=A0A7S9PYU4_9SPHI|nr:hypothetical protein [Pedobacter endophyticus]QPH39843.1 hypothetical protein IZT61_00735 [Pedobacter endophyticus]